MPVSRAAAVLDERSTVRITHGLTSQDLIWSLRAESVSQAFKRACKAASITGRTFHDLRHEAASRLSEKAFSPLEVAGHHRTQDDADGDAVYAFSSERFCGEAGLGKEYAINNICCLGHYEFHDMDRRVI